MSTAPAFLVAGWLIRDYPAGSTNLSAKIQDLVRWNKGKRDGISCNRKWNLLSGQAPNIKGAVVNLEHGLTGPNGHRKPPAEENRRGIFLQTHSATYQVSVSASTLHPPPSPPPIPKSTSTEDTFYLDVSYEGRFREISQSRTVVLRAIACPIPICPRVSPDLNPISRPPPKDDPLVTNLSTHSFTNHFTGVRP
ncbi:hypothetical protein CEXT_750541 [Caerostris extrusa]|uniref:Uncharacterized protein n=1 Tax=Caerostris extrusa TaxID=172846 RepID=A0AAV4TQ74_CAEEX|nr:hypothetical protein CEXT_750541 [Caerostris extrusa]